MASSFDDLDTPCLLLDHDRVQTNADRMEARARALGVALRVHLKTSKSVPVARLTPSVFSHGATVSTLAEAEAFAAAGVPSLFLALAPDPRKAPRLAALPQMTVGSDALAHAQALAQAVGRPASPLGVAIEIDCGDHRGGLDPEAAALLELAAFLEKADGLHLAGVFTHAGHSYEARNVAAQEAVAAEERTAILLARDRLVAAGHAVPMVSVGSSPSLWFAQDMTGVTEARAGVFIFSDGFQAALGVGGEEDIALHVLTTVVAHRPDGAVLIDAGGLALSKDRSMAALPADQDQGYGRALDVAGQVLEGAPHVAQVWQEHGLVRGTVPLAPRCPIGTRLRIAPNHACMTAAAHPHYVVHRGDAILDRWDRVNGW